MTPELETVVNRLELVERQNRSLKSWSAFAVIVALAAVAVSFVRARPAPVTRLQCSLVETNRLLLRDLDGRTAGGLEVDRAGTIRLVLGTNDGRSGGAFLEVRRDSIADLTLRGPDGGVRATLLGAGSPSLLLVPEGRRPTASLTTSADGAGSIVLTDGEGRLRFRAP